MAPVAATVSPGAATRTTRPATVPPGPAAPTAIATRALASSDITGSGARVPAGEVVLLFGGEYPGSED